MVIGFCGRKRSGKTTLAQLLQREENAVIITIADYLKHLCCELLNISYEELINKKDSNEPINIMPNERWYQLINKRTGISIENVRNELKNVQFVSVRQLLQVIGTDVIRKYNEGWHVQKMVDDIKSYSDDKLIVVDDVRFPNERDAIHIIGGKTFFIIRTNPSEVSNHSSETSLSWQEFSHDEVIINDNISKEAFEQHFLIHYRNNFDIVIPKSIFLNENEDYLPCSGFGYKKNNDNELLKDVIEKVKNSKLFMEYGIIRYKTYSRKLAEQYMTEVSNEMRPLNNICSEFITINPLITENLKIYL